MTLYAGIRMAACNIRTGIYTLAFLAVCLFAIPAQAFHTGPTCPGGTVPSGGSCVCQDGGTYVNGRCTCPVGTTSVAGRCTCPDGESLTNGQCSCPYGENLINGRCGCPDGETVNALLGRCSCPDGETVINGQCTCPSGEAVINGTCQSDTASISINTGIPGWYFTRTPIVNNGQVVGLDISIQSTVGISVSYMDIYVSTTDFPCSAQVSIGYVYPLTNVQTNQPRLNGLCIFSGPQALQASGTNDNNARALTSPYSTAIEKDMDSLAVNYNENVMYNLIYLLEELYNQTAGCTNNKP